MAHFVISPSVPSRRHNTSTNRSSSFILSPPRNSATRFTRVILVVVAVWAVLPSALFAQYPDPVLETGIQPFQSYDGTVDAVNLATGQLSLHIPLVSFPQRGGKLHLNYQIYYQSYSAAHGTGCGEYGCWWVFSNLGQVLVGSGGSGLGIVPDAGYPAGLPDGTTHTMAYVSESSYINNGITYFTYGRRSVDGSGIVETDSAGPPSSTTTIDRDGTVYYCSPLSSLTCTLTDTNGNYIVFSSNGYSILDTMGKQTYPTDVAEWFPTSGGTTSQCPSAANLGAGVWSVPGPNGATANYILCGGSLTEAVVLPDGQSYLFQYEAFDLPLLLKQTAAQVFYVLSKVTFPSGGSISYGYSGSTADPCENSTTVYVPVLSRTVNANDGTGPHTWTYNYNNWDGITTVTDPLGNVTYHTFNLSGSQASQCDPYETQTQYEDNASHVLKTVNTKYSYQEWGYGELYWLIDVLPTSTTTAWPNGQQSTVTRTYDNNHGVSFPFSLEINSNNGTLIWSGEQSGYTDNPWTTSETDYTGSTLRTTTTSYLAFSNSNYFTNNLLDLASSVQVQNGGGTQQAYTSYGYDESGLQSSGVTEQKVAGESYPGNQTSVHHWLSSGSAVAQSSCNVSVASGGYLVTNNIYFDTGEIQNSTDPCLYPTSYVYSSTYYGAYPTTVTNALSQNTTVAYDFNTGLVTSVTDPNSQQTTKSYDIMGRLTGIAYPDGGSTTYCYTDLGGATCTQASSPPYNIVTTKAITSSLNETTTAVFDGLDRVAQTQLNSDTPSTTYTQIVYDGLGRKSQIYNPTRCNPPTTNCGETTWGYTTYNYDAISRLTSVVEQDGSTVSTNYAAFPCTTVTDEVGNARESCMDGLGRLTSVLEDPGSAPHLNYQTVYAYDALDDLLSVTQNGSNSGYARKRTFAYDSLSRLTSASNPETGAISYGYDADGNVIAKTAPSPNQPPTGTKTATTSNTYDTLNRLVGKSYNDGYALNAVTPPAGYAYDGNTLAGCTIAPPGLTDPYPVGHRTSMCDGSGGTAWQHDKMGRIVEERRTISKIKGDYENYVINLDGSVAKIGSVTLGYAISYTYGGAARPLTATDSLTNFVTGATYAPPGELTGGTLGSSTGFAGITIANAFNDRLQPILLSAASPSGTVFGECFDFHLGVALNTSPCPALNRYTTGNNGNVYQIVNTRDNSRNQNFIYDSLNRIQQAYSNGAQWGETFGPTATGPGVAPTTPGIDAWGNLTNRSAVTGKAYYELLSVSAGTNNQLSGFGYDSAGNMISNGSASYVYDAEDRLIATAGDSYLYDGDGQRVEKCTEGTTPGTCATSATGVLYWRGSGNAPLEETDLSGNVQNTYIFFNGQRVARSDSAGAIHYYFSDRLGSHGVVENATGTACEQDIDYYPYGGNEEDYCPTVAQNYKFTGKERDVESVLDYFGARHYASSIGRFMSVDPAFESEILELPQTWNRYSYVYNRPSYSNDPDGRCPPCIGALVGGVVEGGFDLGKQLYNNGGSLSNVSWGEVGANALGGAVTGGLAVATGGASLVENAFIGDVLAGGTANVIGGIVTRTAEGKDADEVLSGTELSQNALAGFVGGYTGHVAEEFVHVPGVPVYKRNVKARVSPYTKALNNRRSAFAKQNLLAASAHATTSGLLELLMNGLFGDGLTPDVTHKISYPTDAECARFGCPNDSGPSNF